MCVELVFADVIEVSQVGAAVAACLRGAHSVEAGVAAQLGQAGATVVGPGSRGPEPPTRGLK